jgi:catechol 2,3-dioxygenase-like lactoylglutathione lyase family enzyme
MTGTVIGSLLLASRNPDALNDWYTSVLPPKESYSQNGYRFLDYGSLQILIDSRDDIAAATAEPGRLIVNFHVPDAREAETRLNELGVSWVAELEDRDGNLFGTVSDPDGNLVQIIQFAG